MAAMRAMHYSAIGITSYDLSAGSDFLLYLQDTYGIPFVSMNLISRTNGRTLFRPYIITHLGGIKIAVLGLTDLNPNSLQNDLLHDLATLPWQEALQNTLQEVEGAADMIILLSSYPEQVNKNIAGQYKAINLILQAGGSGSNRAPIPAGNALITQTASRGKYVGKIDINWSIDGIWGQDKSTTQIKDLNDHLDRVNWRIDRLEKKDDRLHLEGDIQYRELLQSRSDLQAELKKISQREQQASIGLSTYRNTFIPLPKSLPEDPEVRTIINKANQAVNEISKKRRAELKKENVNPGIMASMAGWQSCRSCHPDQTERWQQTGHARAWETLAAKNKQFNLDCLICHVTLPTYNQEVVVGINLTAFLSPEFHGVGCEACHGPGKKHVDSPASVKLGLPTAKTCTACHTPDQDDNFDFDRKLKILGCREIKN